MTKDDRCDNCREFDKDGCPSCGPKTLYAVYGYKENDFNEPKCLENQDHDWQSPIAIVGGNQNNPGVWRHNSSVIIKQCCINCGCLRGIRYEPKFYLKAHAWIKHERTDEHYDMANDDRCAKCRELDKDGCLLCGPNTLYKVYYKENNFTEIGFIKQHLAELLRYVLLKDLPRYRILTWDVNKTDKDGRSQIGYSFSQDGRVIFSGTNLSVPVTTTIDSDETLQSILVFATLRKGDVDAEYFAKYTPDQLAFSESSECEALQALIRNGFDVFDDLARTYLSRIAKE